MHLLYSCWAGCRWRSRSDKLAAITALLEESHTCLDLRSTAQVTDQLSTCLQVEEQKRRAEADKLAAITALEVRSREFMVEKEEKRRLEARITSMQSQLLIGGHKIEDMPVFR